MRALVRFWAPLAGALLFALPVAAQTPAGIEDVLRQQQQIIEREEQQRRLERDRFLGGTAEPSQRSPDFLPQATGGEGPCVDIDRIRFEGAKRVPSQRLELLVRNRQGACLTLTDIQNVLRTATNYYVEKGYVTSRAYLVPQDLGSGELRVLIVEGSVSEVLLKENGKARRGATQLFGERSGRIMNIRDFEQGLEQINRLGSKEAVIRIEPGAGVGQSIVTIEVKDAYAVQL